MNLLVTGAWQCTEEQLDTFRTMGHDVVFLHQEKDSLPCPYEWVEGVVCNGLFLSHPIEKFINLRYIRLTSAGTDRVPVDYIKEHNIELHNAGAFTVRLWQNLPCVVFSTFTNKVDFFIIIRNNINGKSTAILVNISRGAVIDTNALIDHIGHIAGAVLDVFEEEPLPTDSPLWDKENVIITPHNSFVGDGNAERLTELIMSQLEVRD